MLSYRLYGEKGYTMYRVISFYFMSGKYDGKIEKGPEISAKDTAISVANKLNSFETEKSPVVRSLVHGVHVPVKVITKEEYFANKWDEFAAAYNKLETYYKEKINPVEAFETWINYYNYLTANQYMMIL